VSTIGSGVIDYQICVRKWQDFSTPKACVKNVHRVLERKLEEVDATARPLYR